MPLSVYGRHKLQGERLLRNSGLRWLIVRLPWVIGNVAHASDPIQTLIGKVLDGYAPIDDSPRFATDARWIAACLLELMAHGTGGIVHLTADAPISRYGFLLYLCACHRGLSLGRVQPKRVAANGTSDRRAIRPAFIKLRSVRPEVGRLPPCVAWQRVAERYCDAGSSS